MHGPVASTVMQAGIKRRDTVLIAGRVLKRDGKLLATDLERRKSELGSSGERILREFGIEPQRAV